MWDGSTWADAWSGGENFYCRSLAVVSSGEAYAWCPSTSTTSNSGQVLLYDGSTWATFATYPSSSELRFYPDLIMRAPDGTIRLFRRGRGAVLEGTDWREFSLPEDLGHILSYVPYGAGAFVGDVRSCDFCPRPLSGLWYLGPADEWHRVWLGPDLQHLRISDLGVADGAVFVAASAPRSLISRPAPDHVLRGTP